MKLAELRKLPERKWDDVKSYDSIYVINSRKKHDSGFALMMVIGVNNNKPVEIAAYCDDICWDIGDADKYTFRTDMLYPSGVIHFWSNEYKYKVGCSLSSLDIKLAKKANAQST